MPWTAIHLPWVDPLSLLSSLDARQPCALLYSGLRSEQTGRYSWLATHPQDIVTGQDFSTLERNLTTDLPAQENAWFGYLGYGLRHALEQVPQDIPGWIRLPPLWMARFRTILRFDHMQREITQFSSMESSCAFPPEASPVAAPPAVRELFSNMTKDAYLEKLRRLIDAIYAGELYQANLTRKFFGHFETPPAAAHLFLSLCRISPAPYSAFLALGEEQFILSSSPECFLSMDAAGRVCTRPIKGSASRALDPAEDARIRQALSASSKDRAENLMIVDLMRNDLSRHCVPGSVEVERLFEVNSYATIHHLSSTVCGQLRKEDTPLALVKGCFPPGSMTGAPKIRAMEYCSRLEELERGVYSGALGWFGGDGSCDLSVVIRTLILDGTRFEFQVGGGIVADSQPEAEWRETLTKARGIAACLGIPMERLEGM